LKKFHTKGKLLKFSIDRVKMGRHRGLVFAP
jgi:hypothetical protein